MERLNSFPMNTLETPEIIQIPDQQTDKGWIVTVLDNDYNSIDQVMFILIVATGCSQDEAEIETWEVHHLGKSVVHHGGEKECRRVAEVIRTIGIQVLVTKED